MTGDPDDLAAVLGAAPPPGVAALPESARADLAGLVRAARRRQAQDLQAAFAATLKHIPFPVRGLAKRMLLG